MPTRNKHASRRSGPPVARVRRRAAATIGRLIRPRMRIVLTTHVNADGDGAGSEVAMWHFLHALGARPVIANPTPFPERYRFLLEGALRADRTSQAVREIGRADLIMVLDISDLSRLGHLGRFVSARDVPVVCIDHHSSDGLLPRGPRLIDPAASATGELVHDLADALRWPVLPKAARALYVAVLTDTGGFRFSNTTPRTLRIAAKLLEEGVDPEGIYSQIYSNSPEGRVRLLAEVLSTLVVEPDVGLAWMTVPPGALERHSVDSEDLEGFAEYPRSIRDVRLGLLFRQIANGRIKVSFRSMGDTDVARLAGLFGGGGHRKAAGASLEGSLAGVQTKILGAARSLLQKGSRG